MDMFPDTAGVREIQHVLDDTIQQGVRNITRLIRATDPAAGAEALGGGGGGGGGGAAPPRSRGASNRAPRLGVGQSSSLASRLVKDGLLTPDLLRQLQSEWSKEAAPPRPEGPRKNKKK